MPNSTDAICKWLGEIAKPMTDKTEFSHWIDALNVDADDGVNRCFDCCKKEVDRLNTIAPESEYIVVGGWHQVSDYPPVCEGCGLALDDTLTESGIRYELEHYEMHRIRLHGKFRASEAFNFLKIIESAGDEPEYWGSNKSGIRSLLRRLHAIHVRTITKAARA